VEVSVHAVEHRGGWSDGTAVAAELGRRSWRRYARGSAPVMLGPCKRVHEVGNDEAKVVVHLVTTVVAWSIGSDSGNWSSARPRRRSRSAAR
jgi:hypothetical protein